VVATVWSPSVAASSARIAAAPASAVAGTSLVVQGSGFGRNARGTVALDGMDGVTFQASSKGSFSLTFTIPPATSPGAHQLAALSTKGSLLAATSVAVTAPVSSLVTACALALCVAGRRWMLFGASDYGGLDDPAARASMAASAGLNTLRVVDFLDEHGDPATAPFDPAKWARVDAAIAAAAANGLRVILDLSTYRNILWNAGLDPYAQDWGTFVAFVSERRNTVTGLRYGDDPAIAVLSFAGEVEPLNTPANVRGVTTQELTDFFARTLAQWRAHDAVHLLSTGGLAQLDWDSGIDWRAVFALPSTDVCSIHAYSAGDQTVTIPAVASFCQGLGKPWITEEFGWPQSIGDAARGSEFSAMYALQRTYAAAGVGFWNLGPELIGTRGVTASYDVSPSTPQTWAVVVSNAP
jgi:hypothetical protein